VNSKQLATCGPEARQTELLDRTRNHILGWKTPFSSLPLILCLSSLPRIKANAANNFLQLGPGGLLAEADVVSSASVT
jgi:hypothetical protein